MISSDEVNFLVYRYLLESGFSHSAFTFAHESLTARSVVADAEVPPGALVSFLQKGLQYVEVESHLQEDGTERPCDEPFHLLAPHICRVKYTTHAKRAGAADGSGIADVVPEIPTADVTILKGHTSEAITCQFHPIRPDLLATGSGDATSRLWRLNERVGAAGDTASTALRHTAAGPRSKDKDASRVVSSLDWSPDGARLATGCYDGKGRVWSVDGGLQHVLNGHTQPILSLQWSPAGQYIVTGSVDRTAIVWDASTGTLAHQFAFHTGYVLDVDWASDGQFAVCSSDKTVALYDVSERTRVRTFSGHTDEVNAIHWNPAKSILASASDDGTAKLWSAAGTDDGSGCVHTLTGHKKRSLHGQVGADGGRLAQLDKRRVPRHSIYGRNGEGVGSRDGRRAALARAAHFGCVRASLFAGRRVHGLGLDGQVRLYLARARWQPRALLHGACGGVRRRL